jgi:hypothetical protein
MIRQRFVFAFLGWFFVVSTVLAKEPFHYPEGKHGKGELKIIGGVPVFMAQGKPEEIGEQAGVLVLKPAAGLLADAENFVKSQGWEKLYPVMLKTGNLMKPQFPRDHLTELESAAKASGWSTDLLVFANTIPDLRKLGGCSTLFVNGAHSATGGPLFGRNVDLPPFGPLPFYTLVAVYRPEGKRAFASVTYPGQVGVLTGINDKGLALADLTVNDASDGSPRLDPTGIPYALAMRRVLEECATVDEAEKLLRSLKRTVRQNIAICDANRGAVFEITPKTLVVRPEAEGFCACTNHFRSKELSTWTDCKRYATLDKTRGVAKLDVAAVSKQMDAVSQGNWTLQTMVFEPATLKLHLAYGPGPATRLPLKTVDLASLFGGTR